MKMKRIIIVLVAFITGVGLLLYLKTNNPTKESANEISSIEVISLPNHLMTAPSLELDEKSVSNQIQIITDNFENGTLSSSISDVLYTVTDLDQNGRLEIIWTFTEGSGKFTRNHTYEINEDYNGIEYCNYLDDMETHADIGYSYFPVYYNGEENRYAYIVEDFEWASPSYRHSKYSMVLKDGWVEETRLGYERGTHIEFHTRTQKGITEKSYKNDEDETITVEEFEQLDNTFFVDEERLNTIINWERIPKDIGEKEVYDLLYDCYENFQLAKIVYEELDALEGVQEVKTPNYNISQLVFHNDGDENIKIQYPKIEIFGDKNISDKINKIFCEEAFPFDETEQSISDYAGAQGWWSEYTITYADAHIISMNIKFYGGAHCVNGYNQGLTVSLQTGEKLDLASLGISESSIVEEMDQSPVYVSPTVHALQTTTDDISLFYEDGYDLTDEINVLGTNEYTNPYTNFFMGSNCVYMIVGTEAVSAEKTGYIKIKYDLQNTEGTIKPARDFEKTVGVKQLISENYGEHVTISAPVLKNSDGSDNKELNYLVEATISAYFSDYIDMENPNATISIDVGEAVYFGENIISIPMEAFLFYKGAAYPTAVYYGININTETQSIMELKDIINTDGLTDFLLSDNAIEHRYNLKPYFEMYPESITIIENLVENEAMLNKSFYVTENSIIIIINGLPHSFGDYSLLGIEEPLYKMDH